MMAEEPSCNTGLVKFEISKRVPTSVLQSRNQGSKSTYVSTLPAFAMGICVGPKDTPTYSPSVGVCGLTYLNANGFFFELTHV